MADVEFWKWFRDQLDQREWTQADFARRSGLSRWQRKGA